MVIYETISGCLLFHKYTDLTVFVKVLEGALREARFMDGLWEMLELCWELQPEARSSIEGVPHRLEKSSQSRKSTPCSFQLDGEVDEGDRDSGSDSSSVFSSLLTFHGLSVFRSPTSFYSGAVW